MAEKKRAIEIILDGKLGSGFVRTFDKAANALDDYEKRTRKLNNMGRKLTMGVTLPLVAAGAAAIAFSTKMNEGMANVASLIPGNTKRVAELKAGIQRLAPVVGKMTGDLTEGAYQTISAFGDSADTLKILEINAKAASGGVASTLEAIDLTSAVTKAYGDTSAEAVQKVADLALLTVRLGQTNFPELAASIGRVTPLTKEMGISQEELFGVMATATGVTGKAAEVSTQFRGVIKSLSTPTKSMTKLLKAHGYASGKAAIKSLGLQGTIALIADEAKKSGKPLQNYIADFEAHSLVLGLAGPLAGDFTKKLDEMGNAAGVTDAAFKEVAEGVNKAGFAMKQMAAKGEVVAQKFGDALAPALLQVLERVQPLIDKVTGLADKFTELSPKGQTTALVLLGIAAATGPVMQGIVAIGAVIPIIATMVKTVKAWAILQKIVTAGQWLWNVAIMSNPIGIAITLLGGLVAVVYLLYKNWGWVVEKLEQAWNWLKKIGGSAIASVVGFVTGKGKGKAASGGAHARGKPAVNTGKAHARGGIVRSPQVSWIGERGPEAIIPLSEHRKRAVGLWQAAGAQLGVAGGGGGISVNFAPQITVAAGGDVNDALRSSEDRLIRKLKEIEHDKQRRSFS